MSVVERWKLYMRYGFRRAKMSLVLLYPTYLAITIVAKIPFPLVPTGGKEAADGMCKTVGFSPVFPTKLQIVKTRLVFHNFHMIFNIRWRDLMGYPDFYRDLVKGRLWKFCRFPLNLQIV